MAVSGSDVPGKYDVVIDVGGTKTGYTFDETIDPQARLFGKKKASYSYSPTFVERQNTQGDYGDDSQAFWLTYTQKDWSLGEDQKYQGRDDDGKRRFWRGSKVDVRTEGAASIRSEVNAVTLAAATEAACPGGNSGNILLTTSTNLYDVDTTGSITDRGAHGLGATPLMRGMCFDGEAAFITSTNGGSVGVRRYDATAHTFSTFSATASWALAFLNNTLYGYSAGVLRRYDSAGVATTLFTWTNADGGTDISASGFEKLLPYGGQLLIMIQGLEVSELWLYDGVGVKRLISFDPNFQAYDAVVSNGIVYVSGFLKSSLSSANRGAVYYYANGQIGLLHKAVVTSSGGAPCITTFDGGVVWKEIGGDYVYYNPATGGTSTFASAAGISPTNPIMVSTPYTFARLSTAGGATFDLYPSSSASVATAATITTSNIDFDASLNKLFRGIKVDFDSATDGNGGTVDIAYRVGDVDGSYTTLQTGAVSGTEYLLSGVTGRSISVKVTLNKGTSTSGPTLKRVYARAAPVLNRYRLAQYTLSCFGDPSDQNAIQRLRDGTPNPKTGREQADALITAITSTTPITIYDRFSPAGYTAVLEPQACEVIEIHAEPRVPPVKSGSFIVIVTAREI